MTYRIWKETLLLDPGRGGVRWGSRMLSQLKFRGVRDLLCISTYYHMILSLIKNTNPKLRMLTSQYFEREYTSTLTSGQLYQSMTKYNILEWM